MISINLNPNSADNTGIDVTSVVDQIVQSESAQEVQWQQQRTVFQQQAAQLKSMQNSLGTLKTSVDALQDVLGALSAMQVTSSQPTVVTASAQAGAIAGTHLVTVGNLATTSSYYTDAVSSSSATLTPGSFTLQLGSGPGTVVTIDSTNNTPDKLASYINGQNWGVSASVITDANGARLALLSNTAGVSGDLTISNNNTGLAFHKSTTGVNAALTVDGVPISSASNTVAAAIAGVTLNLTNASAGSAVALTVAANTGKARQAVSDFVAGYNSVMTAINAQFAVDPATNKQGILAGSSAVRTLQTSLLTNVTYAISGNNGLVNLASIGVDMANDGTLSIDSAKLDDALANHFDNFKNLFQGANGTGFAQAFSTQLGKMGSSVDGLLVMGLNENTSSQRMLTDAINDFEDRMAVRRQDLIRQYSQIDTMLRQYPLLMAQITGQLASLPKS